MNKTEVKFCACCRDTVAREGTYAADLTTAGEYFEMSPMDIGRCARSEAVRSDLAQRGISIELTPGEKSGQILTLAAA